MLKAYSFSLKAKKLLPFISKKIKIILLKKRLKKEQIPLTIERIKAAHAERRDEIKTKLGEFENIWKSESDERLWEEMVFCFFTGGCSARMGLRSIEAVRPLLLTGTHDELMNALLGKHRYPRARSGYIVASRDFLQEHCNLELRKKLDSFENDFERRDWLVKENALKVWATRRQVIFCGTSDSKATRS